MKKNLRFPLLMAGFLGLANAAAAQTAAFVQWPLTANAQDNAAVRSANTTAGTATLRRLVLSNGQATGSTTYPAFSTATGQAFAPVADGGGWSTTVSTAYPNPGTGSNPRRRFYEQFTLTAAGASVRVDSLLLNMSIVNSAAGKMAVGWSRSNFVSDSAGVSGGKGPAISNSTITRTGGPLAAGENGTFGVNPDASSPTYNMAGDIAYNGALLPNALSTPPVADQFRFGLNGTTGIVLAAGQTLTVRIYMAVGSSSGGRYALLRNVTLKSQQAVLATRAGLTSTALAAYPTPVQNRLSVPHTAASRDARVTVFSTTGARVANFSAQPGTTETAVDLSSLSRGLYLVEYADGGQRSSARITKE